MKKQIIIAVSLLLSTFFLDISNVTGTPNATNTSVKEQPMKQKATVGIELGLNLAQMDYFIINDFKPGGRIGMVIEFPFSDVVYFQPGCFYAMNGTIGKNNFSSTSSSTVVNVNTIEIPFTFLFKLGQKHHFMLGGGVYLGNNISANATSKLKIGSSSYDDLKVLDYGLGICLGRQARSGFFFKARFQKGLANLNPTSSGDAIKTMCINVDIGFLFGNKLGRK